MKYIITVFFCTITYAFSIPVENVKTDAIISLYKQAFKSQLPTSGFVILIFNEENCSFCFNEYNLFWAKNLREGNSPPVLALYASDRPYTLKEIQKEYNIEVPILTIEPDTLLSLLPNIQLPSAIGFTQDGRKSFTHKMGASDEVVNQFNGYTKLQQLVLGLAAPKKLFLKDSIKIDEKDNIILGNFQIETFNDGYAITDSKKRRLNLYDRTGKQIEMVDFGDSSKFIDSAMPLFTYSKKIKDTLFCLGAKPLLIKKGPTPDKDIYNLLPNLCIIHNSKIVCDTSISNVSILPPLVVLQNSIVAKIMKWNALQNQDSLRAMPTIVQFSKNGKPLRFYGNVDSLYFKRAQNFDFFYNDIVPDSDTGVVILDYLSGRVQVFSDGGKLLTDFHYHPIATGDTTNKFEYIQICRDEKTQKYYIFLKNSSSKKKYVSCVDKNGMASWELLEVPQSTERLVRAKDGKTIYLCNKKRDGIYIEQWVVQ